MGTRKSVGRYLSEQVKERFGHKCAKCGRPRGLQIHHVVPVYQGGTDNPINLVPLCRPCHNCAPDDFVNFIKYLSTPYDPQMTLGMSLTRAMCLYFADAVPEEIAYLKLKGPLLLFWGPISQKKWSFYERLKVRCIDGNPLIFLSDIGAESGTGPE